MTCKELTIKEVQELPAWLRDICKIVKNIPIFQTLFNDIQQGKVSADQMVEMMNPMLMVEDSMKIVQQCMDKGKNYPNRLESIFL